MSPRPYRMEKRQASRDETRQRILDAARELLSGDQSPDLSMEAVARRADVSRLTIYYQFTSRAGLLEALYDHLATRGHMQRMPEVFQQANQEQALGKMIEVFAGFWSTDTAVLRRLRAMGALDAEIGKGIRARDSRRPNIAREVLNRFRARHRKRLAAPDAAVAEVLGMLTSFEAYDALAQGGLNDKEIVATLTRLAKHAVVRGE
jgi:AcrR family transcriptional regulator